MALKYDCYKGNRRSQLFAHNYYLLGHFNSIVTDEGYVASSMITNKILNTITKTKNGVLTLRPNPWSGEKVG